MKTKQLTEKQIAKMFKLSIPVYMCSDNLHEMVQMINSDPTNDWLGNEAKEAAEWMEGRNFRSGMRNEFRTYSGLADKINANMQTGFKVVESAVYGDGFSIYTIA